MQKQRVSRACDTCKRRKIRCTGNMPCAHCIKNKKTCEFKAAYTRGAIPEVTSAPLEEQEKFLEEVGYKRRQVWRRSPARRNSSHVQDVEVGDEEVEDDDVGAEAAARFSEPAGNDHGYIYSSQALPSRQAQEHSPTTSPPYPRQSVNQAHTTNRNSTGTSIYERTQRNLNRREYHQKNPVCAYGDAPLPEIDTSFLIFPSELAAEALIRKYFDFVSATNRLLHRPTVEVWTRELLSNVRGMRNASEEYSHRAVVLMVFATTHEYMDDEGGLWDTDTSFYYYRAAENQLAKETGEVRLATIQARLLQCIYLLSRSRVNQCYSIFTTIVNFIFALGIHRQRKPSSSNDLLEVEMQKRVFWSAYVMDKYLSSCLGRPQILRDEDIDQQLPLFVEDEHLSTGALHTLGQNAQSPIKGAIYQMKLSKIIAKILIDLYSIRKSSVEVRLIAVESLRKALAKWRSEIAHFVDLDPSLLSPLYMRQNMALRLSYSHARILLHRPFLLESLEGSIDTTVPEHGRKLEENINACLDASLDVVKTIDSMHTRAESFNASWFSHYCAYTAIVCLYVHVVRRCSMTIITRLDTTTSNEAPLTWMQHFDTASKCQEQIRSTSTQAKESFSQKCSVVLEELRAEAVIKIRELQIKESNWTQNTDRQHQPECRAVNANPPMNQDAGESTTGRVRMGDSTSFFGGEWNDMNFDQSAPGGGVLYSLFNGLDGIRVRDRRPSGSIIDRIDRWGFSSLTGY